MRVVIIGGGAAGLGIGWRLLQAGVNVTVLERAQPGRGATWAAAGMIAVAGEAGQENAAEAEFSRYSSSLWPEFATELEAASGCPVDYARSGALMVALQGEDASWLPTGEFAQLLDRTEAWRMAPMLTGEVARVAWAPHESQVDNRLLGTALTSAFVRAGGQLVRNEAVIRVEVRAGRVTSAQTAFGHYEADVFVLAAGAWSGMIEGLPPDAIPPVRPVKGQMIALEGVGQVSRTIRAAHVYLVPRGSRVLVGATVEDVGFDTRLTHEAAQLLFDNASALIPSLKDAAIVDHWAGLRPGSPDGLPILGRTPLDGLYAATGQYRNGILFAPAIAEVLCRLVLGRGEAPAAFDPRRFASSASIKV